MGTTESQNERTVISDSKGKVQNGKNKLVQLYNELNDLDTALARDPQCIVTQKKREHVKLKLELFQQHKVRAAQELIGSKREKRIPSFSLNLEKSRANAKIMDCIKRKMP